MRNLRLARSLVFLIFPVAIAPGCQALHPYTPISVVARDAETKKPIPGADVRISYPLTSPNTAPWDSTGKTGEDGIARLRAAPSGDEVIMVNVNADGYMFEQKNLPAEASKVIEQASFFTWGDRQPVTWVVELYADPHPTVELVIPVGYHGVVKADVQIRDDASYPAGQRCFRYEVSPSGEAQVVGPILLKRVFAPDFHAKIADGALLTAQPKEAELGFWSLRSEGSVQIFWVGTQNEYDNLRRSQKHEGAKSSRAGGGGKGGGGGHRGHKGNQPPSDPGPAETTP
jgi:hypothetical protein